MRKILTTLGIVAALGLSSLSGCEKRECVETRTVCQVKKRRMYFNGKVWYPVTKYVDVDCSEPYDRKIERCVKYRKVKK